MVSKSQAYLHISVNNNTQIKVQSQSTANQEGRNENNYKKHDISKNSPIPRSVEGGLAGWLVVGLTALWDSISVYIGPSPRQKEN